jgi:hypothetical protein
MNIPLKHSDTRWIDYQDAKLLIDYVSDDQFEELEILRYEVDKEFKDLVVASIEYNELGQSLKKKEDKAKKKKYNDLLSSFDYQLRNPKILKYLRMYIACTVKDWQNIKDLKSGNDIKCELDGDKLNKSSLRLLTENPYNTLELFNLISAETEFNGIDKKKFNTVNS